MERVLWISIIASTRYSIILYHDNVLTVETVYDRTNNKYIQWNVWLIIVMTRLSSKRNSHGKNTKKRKKRKKRIMIMVIIGSGCSTCAWWQRQLDIRASTLILINVWRTQWKTILSSMITVSIIIIVAWPTKLNQLDRQLDCRCGEKEERKQSENNGWFLFSSFFFLIRAGKVTCPRYN